MIENDITISYRGNPKQSHVIVNKQRGQILIFPLRQYHVIFVHAYLIIINFIRKKKNYTSFIATNKSLKLIKSFLFFY